MGPNGGGGAESCAVEEATSSDTLSQFIFLLFAGGCLYIALRIANEVLNVENLIDDPKYVRSSFGFVSGQRPS